MNIDIQSIKQRFGIIGNNPLINHALEVAASVASTELTVLIFGESGTGKEIFSKIIHQLSPRKHGKFIAINCGAIPEGTIDSELFGHEKGSFTGAHEARQGYFEVTDGGTIFLDEIGELPLGTQARLLRVLELGEYIRVGSSKPLKTNVRVVAATNINLLDAINLGKFRKDLYYRLSTVPIEVPPLRERGEDIYLLFRKFTSDFSEKYRSEPVTLDNEAKEVLLNFRFPGNIRQLKNICEQVSVLEKGKIIQADSLKKYLPEPQTSTLPALYTMGNPGGNEYTERELLYKFLFEMKRDMFELKKIVYEMSKGEKVNLQNLEDKDEIFGSDDPKEMPLHDVEKKKDTIEIDTPIAEQMPQSLSLQENEKELILKALAKNKNRRNKAARELGISERTLYRKLIEYDIES
ncbi:MAG: sigma-54-dependent Fis family transcriptional regulator [Bacteroidetes bacterium RIFCSPLOWO2_02_FULL_36_8]|nr:MAG: sigma-54-dependent Fis family transcriptional regulator [Bacteroidetes bacterium RIFCSPLOWO2_02_FULL_36_8]OFY68758.1 MAG: sigma-54-dependent Fis family transcriptional regulator [Bacteroidetes bacterium RIFCSPLOWO2_12_FULL_37_12]